MKLLAVRKRWYFVFALLVGIVYALAGPALARLEWSWHVKATELTDWVSVTAQLQPDRMALVRSQGCQTVIDLRPDGEAPDEPTSKAMAAAAHANQLGFAYVPVPHGDMPDAIVQALGDAMSKNRGPVLLYCRTGRRAVRAWALVEASQLGGMNEAAILDAVKRSGFSADDLRDAIVQRIAARQEVRERTR